MELRIITFLFRNLSSACSLDGHFVFSVKTTDTEPPVDPSSLTVKDHPHCFPVITTADMAVFKIGIMDCGAKMKVMHLFDCTSISQNEPYFDGCLWYNLYSWLGRWRYSDLWSRRGRSSWWKWQRVFIKVNFPTFLSCVLVNYTNDTLHVYSLILL